MFFAGGLASNVLESVFSELGVQCTKEEFEVLYHQLNQISTSKAEMSSQLVLDTASKLVTRRSPTKRSDGECE